MQRTEYEFSSRIVHENNKKAVTFAGYMGISGNPVSITMRNITLAEPELLPKQKRERDEDTKAPEPSVCHNANAGL